MLALNDRRQELKNTTTVSSAGIVFTHYLHALFLDVELDEAAVDGLVIVQCL